MKTIMATLATVLMTLATQGQGYVQLNNRLVGLVDAPIMINGKSTTSQAYGGSLANVREAYGEFNVGLINATTGAVLGPTTTFRTDSLTRIGYINAPLAGVDLAGATSVRLAAWKGTADTAGYEAAKASCGMGESPAFPVVGGPISSPSPLIGLTSFSVVFLCPEPSTIALFTLGGMFLAAKRRRVEASYEFTKARSKEQSL